MDNYRNMINAIMLSKKEEDEIELLVKKLMGEEYEKFTRDEQIFLLRQYHAHINSPLDIKGYFKDLKKRLSFSESRKIFLEAYGKILSENKDEIKEGIKIMENNLNMLDYDILINGYSVLSKAFLSIDDLKNAKRYANKVLEIDPFFPSAQKIINKK